MDTKPLLIDTTLVRHLVDSQFPQWKDLPIKPVAVSGWDNRTFHLGEHMLVRMPSSAHYAAQVEKEHTWLPKLAPLVPLPIPEPLAMGKPAHGYPWKWSIYRWLEGETVASAPITDLCDFASSLAQFIIALHRIDPTGGPVPGEHNFYRGGNLTPYMTLKCGRAIEILKDKIDAHTATQVWQSALASTWHDSPVWVHGDISAGNLLVRNGQLCAVIDFGTLGTGDPACDLAITWTLFEGKSREIFKTMLSLDAGAWARGRAWTLWKALIAAAGFSQVNNLEATQCWRIIDEVLADHKRKA